MKKICRACDLYYDETDVVCCECGRPLEGIEISASSLKSVQSPALPNSAGIQQDNRIHRGDDISIGGDSINAQNVDKRNVTNNTNTTINNIQNVEELVKCDISGRWIPKVNSYECPVCKRTVSIEYYVHKKRMCEVCAEKAETELLAQSQRNQQMSPNIQERMIPPVMPSGTSVEPIVVTPIVPFTKKSVTKYIVTGILIFVVIGGGLWWVNNKEKNEIPPVQEVMVTQKKSNPQSHVPSPSKPSVEKVAIASVNPEKTPSSFKEVENKKEEVSLFDRGKQAFNSKDYVRAALLLEQAIAGGTPQAGYFLSILYQRGDGVTKSVKKAFDYMKLAAEGGYADAYFDLAEMYRMGVGTEPNHSLAKKWYEQSAVSSASNADMAVKTLTK